MATIYDVSKETGYSIATVSKVINGYKGVNAKTKVIIEKKIKELGFTPNSTARTLATKKSWMIAIIYDEEDGMGIMHPHYSHIIQGFKKEAGNHGYDILFINNFLGERRMSFLEHCKYRNVDGVLIALDNPYTDLIVDILADDIPRVSIETIYNNTAAVLSDYTMGATQALSHLYMLGHKKIACISGPLESLAGTERYSGYEKFMLNNGLEINPKHCVVAAKYSRTAGIEAVNTLLQQCWNDMPTAIYAAHDDYAYAACEVLIQRGFHIPEDISIVGSDDLPITAYASPGITSVRQNRNEIGLKAARVLTDLMEGRTLEQQIIRIPTKLIVRQTTFRNAHQE